MKVTVLLRNDHDAVKSLFSEYKKTGLRTQNGKKELFDVIRRELLVHIQMETEIFYPALAATASRKAGQLVASAMEERGNVERLLDEIAGLHPQDRELDGRMDELIAQVTRHIDREEEEIFDEARKSLPEHRLEELGLEMAERRKLVGQLAA